jgi:uncharacterized protein (TIGR00369 family)
VPTPSSDLSDLQARLDQSPFHRLFSLTVESFDPAAERLSIRQAYTPSVERGPGSRQYHGGAIASLIDIAGDYALVAMLNAPIPTVNFRVDSLRPATDTSLLAVGTVRRAGRTVAVVDIDVTDDGGRLIAVGRGCYATAAAAPP